MYGSSTDRRTIKAELAEWLALAEQDANREHNTYPAPCDASDRDWLVSLNVEADADGPAPVEALVEPASDPADWPAWTDEDCWELGEEDQAIDYAVLETEQWTLAPGAEADFEHLPGLIG